MYRKKGFPEVDDFVICTVKDVSQHSVSFELDEYKGLEGVVNSSEMSRKWARNIRVFFKPKRKMVCKVIRLDKSSQHIDLSIKRVGAGQEKTKLEEWANEKKADELLNTLSKATKKDYNLLFKKIGEPVLEKYGLIYPFFLEILENDTIIDELKLDSKLSSELITAVKRRIKKRKTKIVGILNIKSLAPNGLQVIQSTIKMLEDEVKKSGNEITIKYLGAPKYKLVFESTDLKHGESILQDILQRIEKYIKKQSGSIEFQKQ